MKKITVLLLALMLIIPSVCPVSVFAADVPHNGITVTAIDDGDYSVEAGGDTNVLFRVTNNGPTPLENVNLYVSSVGGSGIASLNGTPIIELLETDKPVEVSARLVSVSDDTADYYTVTLTARVWIDLATSDENGETRKEIVDLDYIDVEVESSSSSQSTPTPAPSPNNDSIKPIIVQSGQPGDLRVEVDRPSVATINLKNIGTANASNVAVYPKANAELNVLVTGNTGTANNLNRNSSMAVRFTISTRGDKIATNNYEVGYTVIYFDSLKTQQQYEGSFYVRVENGDPDATEEPEPKPTLILGNFSSDKQTVLAGEPVTLGMEVRNNSEAAAKNVSVALGGLSADGVSISNSTANVYYEQMAVGAANSISFNLVTHKDMKSGSYPITVTLKYTDKDGVESSNDYTYYVTVLEVEEEEEEDIIVSGNLKVADMTSPAGTFSPGDVARFSLTLQNIGKDPIENIKVSAKPEEGMVVPRSANVSQVLSLAPGASETMTFDVSATEATVTQSYTVGFNIEYDSGEESAEGVKTRESFSQYGAFAVFNPKEEEEDPEEDDKLVSKPKIIVSKYEVDPIIVMAGQEFDLYLEFQNTHAAKSVHNVKASFTVDQETEEKGNVFTPVNASNTHYIDAIQPKGVASHQLRMYAVPDAQPRNYIININFEYEDSEGNEITGTEQIGINVKQIVRLEVIGDIVLPESIPQNEMIWLNFQLQNSGKVTLSNLRVSFEGEAFDTSAAEMIYGNMAIGDYQYYDGRIAPIEMGEHDLKMIISYDDDTGGHVEDVREFKVNVTEPMVYDDPYGGGMMPDPGMMEEELGFPANVLNFVTTNWIPFAVGAVVLAAGITALVVFVKRRRQRSIDVDE